MAELRKWAASALLLAAAVAAAVFAPSAGSEQGVGGPNTRRMVCRARVLAVDDSGLQTLGHVQYGSQTLEVELLDGDRKGMRARAGNTVRGQMELDTIYRPGDVLLASAPSAELSENATPVLTALSPWRLAPTLAVFALFALLLVAFAGRTGLNALTSFVFCAFVVWRVVVPLALAGWNASLVAFVATGVMAAAIMALVGGLTRKAAVAFGGCMLGVAAGLCLAHLFGSMLGINGATLPFVQTLVYSGAADLDLADLFLAATILAGSGAMMDLAMDIAAGAREVARHSPLISRRELFMSAVRIGRATVGTMTTTLLLAYSGGYLSLLMVFAAEGVPPHVFLNSPIVAAEVAKTLVGSFAVVLVAPFTAFLAAAAFAHRNRHIAG